MIDLNLFSDKKTLPWQPILEHIGEPTFAPKWIGISQFRFKDIKWQYFSYILCKFDEDIGPLTPEIRRVEAVTFGTIRQNWRIPPIISECTGLILTKFSELVDIRVEVIKLTFFLRSPKGRCYGNQLILGIRLQTSKLTISTLCFGVPKRIALLQFRFSILMGIISLHRVEIWLRFGSVIPEFTT